MRNSCFASHALHFQRSFVPPVTKELLLHAQAKRSKADPTFLAELKPRAQKRQVDRSISRCIYEILLHHSCRASLLNMPSGSGLVERPFGLTRMKRSRIMMMGRQQKILLSCETLFSKRRLNIEDFTDSLLLVGLLEIVSRFQCAQARTIRTSQGSSNRSGGVPESCQRAKKNKE